MTKLYCGTVTFTFGTLTFTFGTQGGSSKHHLENNALGICVKTGRDHFLPQPFQHTLRLPLNIVLYVVRSPSMDQPTLEGCNLLSQRKRRTEIFHLKIVAMINKKTRYN